MGRKPKAAPETADAGTQAQDAASQSAETEPKPAKEKSAGRKKKAGAEPSADVTADSPVLVSYKLGPKVSFFATAAKGSTKPGYRFEVELGAETYESDAFASMDLAHAEAKKVIEDAGCAVYEGTHSV